MERKRLHRHWGTFRIYEKEIRLNRNKNLPFGCVLWQSCGFTVAKGVRANSNLLMSINRGTRHFLRAKSANFLPTSVRGKVRGVKKGAKTGWALPGVNLEPVLLLSLVLMKEGAVKSLQYKSRNAKRNLFKTCGRLTLNCLQPTCPWD